MNDMRERLIELLENSPRLDAMYGEYDVAADWLLANGVTVLEWISFDEVKPKDGQSVLGITTEGEVEVFQFDEAWKGCLCRYGGLVKTFNITHWMPLPQPPKGE